METVCHRCPWWTQVRGVNPNTGEEADRWDCAIALMPMLSIEVAKETRQAGAATESFRNEVVARADHAARLASRPVYPTMIEG